MKKFLCVLMCLVMFMTPVLTGCTSSDGDSAETGEAVADTETVRYPMTISLWLPTDENTTAEAIALVEARLNELITAKYDTAIELHAIPADEYQAKIDEKLTSIDDVKKAAEAAEESIKQQLIDDAIAGIVHEATEEVDEDAETAEVTVETMVDEYGQSVTVYPAVADDQLDIFLVKGYDQYLTYIEEELVVALDEQMADIGKKLNSYIYPHFLDMANIDGLYGIPNNHASGEYQFLLVNKRLVEEWSYSADELSTLADCEGFIKDMGDLKAAGEESLAGVTPLLGKTDPANMIYYNQDGNFSIGGEWSLLCSQITADTAGYSTIEDFTPARTLGGSEYLNNLLMMKKLEELGYVGDGVIDAGEEFAVGVVAGQHEDLAKYEDEYYVFTHAVPVATKEDVFESVFCISTYTKDVSRSMEVLTYLNTNEEIRTVLQYGVENKHWKKGVDANGEDVINVISDDYIMNIVDTGNVYLTYPGDGIPMSHWEHSKLQNIDCVANPYFGFEYLSADNEDNFKSLANLSKRYYDMLQAMTADELKLKMTSLKLEMQSNQLVSGLISKEGNDTVSDPMYSYLESFIKSK